MKHKFQARLAVFMARMSEMGASTPAALRLAGKVWAGALAALSVLQIGLSGLSLLFGCACPGTASALSSGLFGLAMAIALFPLFGSMPTLRGLWSAAPPRWV